MIFQGYSLVILAAVSAALLAVFLDPYGRVDASQPLHRWAGAYAFAVLVQTVSNVLLRPWFYAVCPAAIFNLLFVF